MAPVPDAFVDRYAPVFGGPEALQAELEAPLRSAVRANVLRAPDPEGLVGDLADRGIVTDPVPWWPRAGFTEPEARVGNLPEHSVGRLYGQGAASLLPALALDPEPGEEVLEVAAAPGSKAGLLAELMDNRGLLVANDANEGRAFNLVSNLQRLGVRNACVTIHDGRHFPSNPFDRGEPGYDRILVDAPCSNLGQARPDWLPRHWRQGSVDGVAALQRGLVRRAAQLLRPGGHLVYSTCTFVPTENEGVVDWLVEHHPLEPVDHGLDVEGADPVRGFHDEDYGPAVDEALRVHRTHHGTEAFFVAAFRKGHGAGLGGADQPASPAREPGSGSDAGDPPAGPASEPSSQRDDQPAGSAREPGSGAADGATNPDREPSSEGEDPPGGGGEAAGGERLHSSGPDPGSSGDPPPSPGGGSP